MPLMHSPNRPAAPRLRLPSAARALGGVVPGTAPDAVTADSAAVDSRALLEGRPRIAIRQRNETYWLHETRQGKLLLTK